MQKFFLGFISILIILLGVFLSYPKQWLNCDLLDEEKAKQCASIALFECDSSADDLKGIAQSLRYAKNFDASLRALSYVESCHNETYGPENYTIDRYYLLNSIAYTYEEAGMFAEASTMYQSILNEFRLVPHVMDHINVSQMEQTIQRLNNL